MASRYYCPQFCHRALGWVDLPSLSSKKEKEANDAALDFAKINGTATRVIRKPHGWSPPKSALYPDGWK